MIDLWVLEQVIKAKDLEYLDMFWKEFNSELKTFVKEREMYDRAWRSEPPKLQ